MSPGDEDSYSNIREILGEIIGKRLVDITQHDKDEYADTRQAYIMLMFEDGSFVKFFVGDDGFVTNCGDDDETVSNPSSD